LNDLISALFLACINYHVDCTDYAASPLNYCADDRYSAWMEWKCAKACQYCSMSEFNPFGFSESSPRMEMLGK